MPTRDRREGRTAIPDNLDRYLTPEQEVGLKRAEMYGWKVKFVRRPVVVLEYEDGSVVGVLEEDGTLDKRSAVRERGTAESESNVSVVSSPRLAR